MGTSRSVEKHHSFEKSLERLEKIVEEMESGSLNLEKMVKHFEEGMKLVDFCSKRLNEVEHKIDMLVRKNDETVLQPFQEDEGTDDADSEGT